MRNSPRKLAILSTPMAILAATLTGCGGGGLGLTGGSVPIGGRSVSGTAVLPGSVVAANAAVTATVMPSGTSIGSTRTDGSGVFTLHNVPANADVDVVIKPSGGGQLEIVIPRATLGAGGGPLNIGEVDANSSLVAAALRLEQAPAPEDSDSIVGNQQSILDDQVKNGNFSQQQQNEFVNNPGSLNAQALTLMVPAANASLQALQQNPSQNTASAALNSLLGYLRAAHARDFHMNQGLRQSLLNTATAGTVYTPAQVAAAFQSAGVLGVTPAQVSAASTRERTELTALSTAGGNISALEAMVIAADVSSNGGLQCNQNAITNFLQTLLSD